MEEATSRHQCLIYEGQPSQHSYALASVIKNKLKENYRCLYLNSPEMVSAMRASLQFQKVDVADEVAKTSLVLTSGTAIAADGRFDVDRMLGQLEDAVVQALKDGFKGLFATGDMTWELGAAKESFARLIDYERRLEKLFHKLPALCGICQYHRDTLPPELMRAGLLSHKGVFINDTLSRINSYYSDAVPSTEQNDAKNPEELDKAIVKFCRAPKDL